MITYFLFANLYGALFYFLYVLFLKDRDAHRWSRFYLLAAAFASLLLPLIRPGLFPVLSPALLPAVYHLPAVTLPGPGWKTDTGLPPVFIIYAVISLLLLTRLALGWIRFKSFLAKQQFVIRDGLRVMLHTGIGPGSFGGIILFPAGTIDKVIFCHEKAHIRQRHFLDKIFFRLLQCLFFPVLPLYIMGRELETVHEFQADHGSVHNREAYLKLLLQQHFSVRQCDLLQSFFHHPLKRRIMMLQNAKSAGTFLRGSLFLAAFVAGGLIMALQSGCTAPPPEPLKKSAQQQTEKIYSPPAVTRMPVFSGDLSSYLAGHIAYPKGYTGPEETVFIQFVVNTEGKVEQVKLKKNPFGAAFARQITDMLENMPQWKPGEKDGMPVKVYFVLPVKIQAKSQV